MTNYPILLAPINKNPCFPMLSAKPQKLSIPLGLFLGCPVLFLICLFLYNMTLFNLYSFSDAHNLKKNNHLII